MQLEVPLPVAFQPRRDKYSLQFPGQSTDLHDFTYGDQSQTLLNGVDCACGYGQKACGPSAGSEAVT